MGETPAALVHCGDCGSRLTDLGTYRNYGKEYYDNLKYSEKGQLIRNHVLELLRWGSKVLDENLLEGKGKVALDVGCAFGYEVELLRSLGYDALGTDISTYGIRQATKNSHRDNFVVCDAQKNLPFRKKFQLITCFDVLEHLVNPLAALKNMYESCNGIILCTTPNKTVEKIVKRILRSIDKTHINVKTPSEWEKQICDALECRFVKVESFLSLDFKIANTLFFRSFRLPFGMDTRILIRK